MNDRPASFKRLLGRTPLRDQPQHREQHGHGNCGARLDQIAAPRLLDDSRLYGSVRELTELPIGQNPAATKPTNPRSNAAPQTVRRLSTLSITSRMSIMCAR